ncbi:MAG: DUF4381 domain-containing protein [Gammaproteobacteria bacterium]|jgi:hypothetical protein
METGSLVLRDIHGLDAVPWWPLAPGWWLVLGLLVCLLLGVGLLYWMVQRGIWLGWRADARRQLHALKKALPSEDPREIAGRLSELLRRIAMVRSGRRAAAGLTGESWLQWLMEHDASGFDWQKRGQMLLVAPYMPPRSGVERKELGKLIRAAIRWVNSDQPSRRPEGVRNRTDWVITAIRGRVRV